ncbi:MAG: ATP-grasp fold amidoligase family protein [Acholeplasma sp.]|nr:ATP-grasp fold amidoligase family protein [Acholeplasma sp.]
MMKNKMKKKLGKIAYFVTGVLMRFSPKIATKFIYRLKFGVKINLKNPKTLNEKLQWYKIYYYNNLEISKKVSDKFGAREYLINLGLEKYLTKLYGIWDDPNQIKWENLPDRYALKCTSGSGRNLFSRYNNQLNITDAVKKMNSWMKSKAETGTAELAYKDIVPRILCEELIVTDDGKPPLDYKFFCEYGEPKFFFIGSDRQEEVKSEKDVKFDYYTMDWEWIPVINRHPNAGDIFEKPNNFDEMVEVVRKISAEFPLVRIDLYNVKGKIYFSEITLLHFGGLATFKPKIYDTLLGDYFKEPRSNVLNHKSNI